MAKKCTVGADIIRPMGVCLREDGIFPYGFCGLYIYGRMVSSPYEFYGKMISSPTGLLCHL